MSAQYEKADESNRRELFGLYLLALDDNQINSWDIVDTSCGHVVGAYARDHDATVLHRLAADDRLWHKRTAMIFAWVRRGDLGPTMEIAERLWHEQHDLLHKAVGWMLREVGKRVDEKALLDFLAHHAHEMPRTELRCAIERFSPDQRTFWLTRRTTMKPPANIAER